MIDIFGRVEGQRHRVKKAIRDVANCEGEIAAENYLVCYYNNAAKACDPTTDWWRYADLRQNETEHEQELAIAKQELEDAKARLAAHQLKLETM